MKSIVILFALVAGIFTQDTPAVEINENERIAFGQAAKKGENLDLVFLDVTFFQKTAKCSAVLVDKAWILTSGRCAYDPQEGRATKIVATISAMTGAAATKQIDKIVIPDGTNGADAMMMPTIAAAYDYKADIPFATVGANNFAMLRMAVPLTDKELDGVKVKKATMVTATDMDTFVMMYPSSSWKFRSCGNGYIDNFNTKPKGTMCADFNIIKSADCMTNPTGTFPEGSFCMKGVGGNICGGDYGGCVYAYKYDSTGKIIDQQCAGITVGSPDIRPDSLCYGGQTIVAMLIPGNPDKWIKNVIAGSYT